MLELDSAIQHLEESLADPTHKWGCEECKQEHEQLLKWLEDYKRLQSESSWIPCSKRMPEVGDLVMIAIANGDIDLARLDPDKAGFSNEYWYNVRNVTHWMLLPQTPKEVDNG